MGSSLPLSLSPARSSLVERAGGGPNQILNGPASADSRSPIETRRLVPLANDIRDRLCRARRIAARRVHPKYLRT
jgi:hypothetical protein